MEASMLFSNYLISVYFLAQSELLEIAIWAPISKAKIMVDLQTFKITQLASLGQKESQQNIPCQ